MTTTDPIADMFTRIRNAVMVRHEAVVMPSSKMKVAIAQIMKDEGFIKDFEVNKEKSYKTLKLILKYTGKNDPVVNGLKKISKPGLRVYVEHDEIPRVYGGLGIAVLSTSKGIMTGKQAWRQGIGGELLGYIW